MIYLSPEGEANSKSPDVLSLRYWFLSLQEKPSDSSLEISSKVLISWQSSAHKEESSLAPFPIADAPLKPCPEPWKLLLNPENLCLIKNPSAFTFCFNNMSHSVFTLDVAWLHHCNNPGVRILTGKLQGRGFYKEIDETTKAVGRSWGHLLSSSFPKENQGWRCILVQ